MSDTAWSSAEPFSDVATMPPRPGGGGETDGAAAAAAAAAAEGQDDDSSGWGDCSAVLPPRAATLDGDNATATAAAAAASAASWGVTPGDSHSSSGHIPNVVAALDLSENAGTAPRAPHHRGPRALPDLSRTDSAGSTASTSSSVILDELSDASASQFQLLGVLGRGAFATCWLAQQQDTGEFVAVKRFQTPADELDEAAVRSVQTEVETLKQLSAHRNVTTYHGCFLGDLSGAPVFSLVLEYCDAGSLAEFIDEHRQDNARVPEDRLWEIAVQCLDALRHIHARKIIHRDLKPANILLQGAGRRVVKLCDFGVSSLAATMASTVIGTPYYLAPELCEGVKYDAKADLWSLGVCLYELCCLRRPFQGEALPMLVMQIMAGAPEPIPAAHYSSDVREMCGALLVHDAWTRPAADTVLAWPVVRSRRDAFEAALQTLHGTAAAEAQQVAVAWVAENAQQLQALGRSRSSSGGSGAADRGGGGESKSSSSSSASSSSSSTTRSKSKRGLLRQGSVELSHHRRLWRFGSGQHSPKLVESMIHKDLRTVALGGTDTTGDGGGGGGAGGYDDDDDDDDDYGGSMGSGAGEFSSFAFAVDEEGDVFTWGATKWESAFTSRLPRALCDSGGVACVACGSDFAVAVDVIGRVWVWGSPEWLAAPEFASAGSGRRNSYGALPNGGAVGRPLEAAAAAAAAGSDPAVPRLLDPFGMEASAASAACGTEFLLVLDRRGRVWSCGDGSEGCLGHGDALDDCDAPQVVAAFGSQKMRCVSAGASFAAALSCNRAGEDGGTLFSWGRNDGPQLGHGEDAADGEPVSIPREIRGPLQFAQIVEVDCGRAHAACVDASGLLYTWGDNTFGELGHGDREPRFEPTLVEEFNAEDDMVRTATCGSHHTCAVTDDGWLFAWGDNTFGAVGSMRKKGAVDTPTQVRKFGKRGLRVESVEAGVHETLVLTRPQHHS